MSQSRESGDSAGGSAAGGGSGRPRGRSLSMSRPRGRGPSQSVSQEAMVVGDLDRGGEWAKGARWCVPAGSQATEFKAYAYSMLRLPLLHLHLSPVSHRILLVG